MISLHELPKSSTKKRIKRVGRGPSSGMGKTSTRGHNGAKSRSGYKRRLGHDGNDIPLYRKLPTRGFSNARFEKKNFELNFDVLERLFADGEVVNRETLIAKGVLTKNNKLPVKILAKGELTKKISIAVEKYSKAAEEKLTQAKIEFKVMS